MSIVANEHDSPLSIEDIQLIDSTKLSALDKHHLRLLAHCLGSFRLMAKDDRGGDLPDRDRIENWLKEVHHLNNEDSFLMSLVEQFDFAAIQLEKIAVKMAISPLELTLEHLIVTLEKAG